MKKLGMYWKKENDFGNSWFWWSAPIETQAYLIESFNEIERMRKQLMIRTWLIKTQTN
jgi:hypothetical protein